MSNHTGKFLSQWQMAEAKRSEAILNSIQKREKTNHPLSNIIAWSCGCCIGPSINKDKIIPTKEEALLFMKTQKRIAKFGDYAIKSGKPDQMLMKEFKEMFKNYQNRWTSHTQGNYVSR
jgi:hypothetical protein